MTNTAHGSTQAPGHHPAHDDRTQNDDRHAHDDRHASDDGQVNAGSRAHGHTHDHGNAHGRGPTQGHDHDAGLAEILDLDAEVLAEQTASIISWLPLDANPRRILDLGCGTGAGTFALLARFPQAEVTAVDASAGHLDRLWEKARALGVAGRVRTVEADLDGDWDDLRAALAPAGPGPATPEPEAPEPGSTELSGPEPAGPELVWASASLHHLAEPDRALRRVRELLAPGGLVAVVELAGFPRFLPADAPAEAPGLEERCHQAADRAHAGSMPHRGADWGPMLTAAGFTVEGTRTLDVHLDGAPSAALGRYALGGLRRLRDAAALSLAADDLAVLDRLLDADDPQSLLHRADLTLRTERSVWAARRP